MARKKSRAPGGLTDWFKEKWVDVKTGKPCGRKKSETKRKGYPACRPTRRVSSKTPKLLSELSPAEKKRFTAAKTGKKKISFQMRRKRKTTTKKK